jgi:hypothetical protein
VGTLLGDGGIRLKGKFARLHIKHSLKQLKLVEYKREIFKNITGMKVRIFSQQVKQKDYNFAEFVTLTHLEFLKYYRLFYPNSKKSVPNTINKILGNPLSLAVWFMDDGSAEYAGASLQTHSFSKRETDKLREVIKLNYGIETGKRKNKGSWIIYFPKACMPKLRNLIGKLMLKEFLYKLQPYSERKTNPVETIRRTPTFVG